MRKLSIGIIWANPYNKNLGVAALAYSSLSLINDIINENNISADISFIGSSKNQRDALIIDGNKLEFNNITGNNLMNWKIIIYLLLHPIRMQTIKLLSFDYIFDIGEGDSFTDLYGDERFDKINNSKRFFNILNTKQILLPQTIGPFNKLNENKAFKTLRKCRMVLCRDGQSFDYSKRFLNDKKITEIVDISFYMKYTKKTFNNGKLNIGINVSGLLWNGGYTMNNQFNLKVDYKELVRKIIDFFSKKDIQIHLIPHVIPLNFLIEDDKAVCDKLSALYNDLIVAPTFNDPQEAKSYISGLDFFIGARMHSCIAAFSTGVPVFPLSYSRKFIGLFSNTLKYKWIGDCTLESENQILNNLSLAFENRSQLKTSIEESNKMIVEPKLLQLKNIIKDILLNE